MMNDERPLTRIKLEGVHHSSFIVHRYLNRFLNLRYEHLDI